MRITFILLVSVFFLNFEVAQSQQIKIVQTPLVWTEEREKLSIEYLEKRHGIFQSDASIIPKMVVVHWTAVSTYEETMKVFKEAKLKGRPELINSSPLNVSSQYIIDRDGTIFQLLPDTIFARHTIGLNYMAIGIENIGSEKNPLTNEQLKANADLITHLKGKYPIEYVIGHHEYRVFKNTDLWRETDSTYFTNKIDPGDEFMKKLRNKLSKFRFKKSP